MNKFSYLSLIAVSAAFVGCNDFDYGVTADTFKQKEYAENFEKVFGTPDPNQDWSMAMLVEANVNLPEIKGTAKMNICTGDPRNSETRLLAQVMLQDGQAHLQFDAIKGHNTVFVTVEQDGQYKVFGQYVIVDGMLNVGELALTRAGAGSVVEKTDFSASCPTTQDTGTKGKIKDTQVQYQSYITVIHDDYRYFTRQEWIEKVLSGEIYVDANTNASPFTDASIRRYGKITGFDWTKVVLKEFPFVEYDEAADTYTLYYDNNGKNGNPDWKATKTTEQWKSDAEAGYFLNGTASIWTTESLRGAMTIEDCPQSEGGMYVGLTDPSTWVVRTDGSWVSEPRLDNPNLQYLKNVEQVPAPSWNQALGYSFFGQGAFFEEKVAYYDSKKRGVFYNDAEMIEMEKGFSITTKGGPITLPYIFGCTAFTNQFGYIYWKDEDENDPDFDPLALPHFILIEDARPSQNIYNGTWKEVDTEGNVTNNIGNQGLERWDDFAGALAGLDGTPEKQEVYLAKANKSYVGTSYRPMYFGDDYKNTIGSYEWGEGYHIVFFILTMANSEMPQYYASRDTYLVGKFNYSLPEYNKRLNHLYQNPDGLAERANDGMVKAIAWSRDGLTFLGFGDDSGDQDLNDIVFLVEGNFDYDRPITKVAPIKWHMNIDGIHHDSNSLETDAEGNPKYKKDDDLFDEYSLNVGGDYTQPANEPVRDGYTFLGWATTPKGTPNKSINGTVADEDGACYFAIWEPEGGVTPETVTVKWHKNYDGKHHDGTNGTTLDDDLHKTDSDVEKGSHPTKPATDPTPQTGKQFLGWAETPNATTPLSDAELAAIVINEDKCFYAVYGNAPTPGGDPEPITWIFACEDLGGTFDYDFNDAVWSVKYAAGQTTAEVTLLAAGGTLPFSLSYDGTVITTKKNEYASETTVYINEAGSKGAHTITVSSDWSVEANKSLFVLTAEGSGGSTNISFYSKESTLKNKTPQVLLLPEGWQWPDEGQNIGLKYPTFKTWAQGNGAFDWKNVGQN